MPKSRFAVAMVAATALAASALAPVASSAENKPSTGQSSSVGHIDGAGYSDECQEAIAQAREDHEQGIEDGTIPGSSFMGPQELGYSIVNGYGSSGMPEAPECIEEEDQQAEDENWEKVPDWLQSMRGNDTTELVFAVVGAILAIGASATQAATIAATFSPEIRNQIAQALKQFGY